MSLHHLRELVHHDLNTVNELIINSSRSSITLASDLINHLIQSGGKRLRPLLVLLVSHACQYHGDQHIILATMMEFFHTATLLHDDVIDESTMRRGQKTAHGIWGSKACILAGDYLFIRFMQLMLDINNHKIMQALTNMGHEITCGELQQLTNQHNIHLSEEEYFQVIRSKTSLFFACAAQTSAILSQSSKQTTDALYEYGLHLGNAFQLTDDVLDYCADPKTMGKNVGDDLANGKPTMPLLYAFQHSDNEQKKLIQHSLETQSLEHLAEILITIQQTNAITYTQSLASHEVAIAKNALSILPDSVYKKALIDLADYAITRDH